VEKKASNKSGWWFFALPLWKMMEWVRQLGWWHFQYDGKVIIHMFQTTNEYCVWISWLQALIL
jgi:hypothetical protein